ncbi:hypothetical protein GALMADRAFT_230964 [Galerina marginata CBS 339.88]|uniref:Peptidase A1 domain-containing protein n=1 Tax=Galerina marginata (strain CBS 339.88) TaxID=685588 RepID=A0A067SG01_GALM3|nr:hypothetical protein GALMADRAFT_230964 [Galerina marginata CBS 339.88]
MSLATFLLSLLLAYSVTADPVVLNPSRITLSVSRRFNITGVGNLVLNDRNRAKVLKLKGARNAAVGAGLQVPVTNAAVISTPIEDQAVSYIASVGVGSPSTAYNLLVDTASSNTWVGAGTPYHKTATSFMTTDTVSVTYGTGSFSGTEFIDQVTLGTNLTIKQQSIGVASTSQGFAGLDGVLGIGPTCLTVGTLSPSDDCCTNTVTDNLFAQGNISANEISLSMQPNSTLNAVNGEITWGGTDTSKFTGAITFITTTNTSPANEFWGIDVSVRFGPSIVILATTAGIIDTASTLILLATNGFTKYKAATGGVLDNATGLLRLTTTQFASLQSLFFVTGGATFELTANGQIWPRALNADIGGTAGVVYLIVADLGSPSGEGLDFILGMTFLQRFYAILDTANDRVGLANTPFTKATTN